MVWQKKSAAPDYVNLTQAVKAALTGSPDAWLFPWFDLVPIGINLDVNALCAAGPRDPVTFDALDFLGYLGGNRFTNALQGASLGAKIEQWMLTKLFEAECENAVTTGETCTVFATATAQLGDGRDFTTSPGWAIPAGVKKIRWKVISWAGGTHDLHMAGYASGSNIANPSPDGGSYMTPGVPGYSTWTAAIDHIQAYSNSPGSVIEFAWCAPGSVIPYVADPIEQPDTAVDLDSHVYTTIQDLGDELDRIERKTHWILDYTLGKTLDEMETPLIADELLEVVADSEDIVLAKDVRAFIVTVSNIANSVDERFGEPRMLHRLGRVVMGNGTLWLPPVEITVTPMMLFKPDPTITVCRVQVASPSTATVTTLVKRGLS